MPQIEINENTIGMWCIHIDDKSDWLAHLARGGPGGKVVLDYRHRYYVDDKIGAESKDRKNWYHGELTGPEDVAIRKMRRVFEEFRSHLPRTRPAWELLKGGRTAAEFLEELATMPGMHVQLEVKDGRI